MQHTVRGPAIGPGERTEHMPRVGMLSRATIRAAIELLQRAHGLTSPDSGFAALQKASQTHNVKLRSVAAAVMTSDGSVRRRRAAPPALSFSEPGNGQPNRTQVLRDLLATATTLSGADYGAVQLRDPVHGGLIIEGHHGFDRAFLDFFSYIDDAGTASGTTMARSTQTFVDDVASSPIYADADRDVVLGAGVRSVLSTPMRDARDAAVGAVTTHFAQPRRSADDRIAATIQQHADECAQWLTWYDATAMPRIVSTAHAAARDAAKKGEPRRHVPPTDVPSPATLRNRLSRKPKARGSGVDDVVVEPLE